jgi:hypothetical protein
MANLLPPPVFNRRISFAIQAFYDEMERLYKKENWRWYKYNFSKNQWNHPNYTIKINSFYKDKTFARLDFLINGVPHIANISECQITELSYEHYFYFNIPREYPDNLGKINIRNKSFIYHPRFSNQGAPACYVVNGDIDRILIDIIYNLLLRPSNVKPPSMFKGQDAGYHGDIMKWYINCGPEAIYNFLYEKWREYHS